MHWCYEDFCPPEICGGPHRVVWTDFGREILRYDQEPIGTPVKEKKVADQTPSPKRVLEERDKFLKAIQEYQFDDRELDAVYSTLQWICGDGAAPSQSYLGE